MTYMIERVARAICVVQGHDPDEPSWRIVGRAGLRPAWESYEPEARAALTAMRKPTEAMLQAFVHQPMGLAFWEAGIDAALTEPKPEDPKPRTNPSTQT